MDDAQSLTFDTRSRILNSPGIDTPIFHPGSLESRRHRRRGRALRAAEKGGRQDLADTEKFEVGVLQAYMPQALSDAEIDAEIAAAMQASGAKAISDMGKVMAILKPKFAGRADMGKVSGLIKAKLAG